MKTSSVTLLNLNDFANNLNPVQMSHQKRNSSSQPMISARNYSSRIFTIRMEWSAKASETR